MGGARAAWVSMCSRMAAITRGSVTTASTRNAAPQRGHRRSSMSNTTRQALHPTHRCAPPLRHGLLVVAGRGSGPWRRHDEAAVARVGGEDAVVAQQMASRARHQRRQAREEVERFEQELGRAVVKRALEPVHDQAVAVAVESLECERGTRDIAA